MIRHLRPAFFLVLFTATAAHAEGWKERFDAICSRTAEGMSLNSKELKELVEKADLLKPEIDALEESPRKVYGKRLQMCRDLFRYVLEVKGKESRQEEEAKAKTP